MKAVGKGLSFPWSQVVVTLDAAGTLFGTAKPVAATYVAIAQDFGATLDSGALAAGFKATSKPAMSVPAA